MKEIIFGTSDMLEKIAAEIESNGEKKEKEAPGGEYLAGVYDASERVREGARRIRAMGEAIL